MFRNFGFYRQHFGYNVKISPKSGFNVKILVLGQKLSEFWFFNVKS